MECPELVISAIFTDDLEPPYVFIFRFQYSHLLPVNFVDCGVPLCYAVPSPKWRLKGGGHNDQTFEVASSRPWGHGVMR